MYCLLLSIEQAVVVNAPGVCPSGSKMSDIVGLSDTVIKPLIVEAEGVAREYTVSDYICLNNGKRPLKERWMYEIAELCSPSSSYM